jgi:signal transduction histidine kinase
VISLRRRLLLSLWLAVSIVGTASALFAYYQVNRETKELLDNQLQQIAGIVAARGADGPRTVKADEHIEIGVWGADGRLQYSSTHLLHAPLAAAAGFSDRKLGTEPYRVYAAVLDGRHIEIAQPVDTREDQAEAAALAAFAPLLVLLPVLALVIALVIRTLLQPVREVAAAVSRRDVLSSEAMQAQSLPKEIAPLVEEINRLLARQGDAVQRERHFIADAAHALRTPLAALQLQVDVLEGSASPSERADRMAELRAGIQRATRLTEQLLSLARKESLASDTTSVVDLRSTLAEAHAMYAPLAAAAGKTLDFKANTAATVPGDAPRLLLICSNLLDNAVRYTREGGHIEMLSAIEGNSVRIEIRDEGPGLEPDELKRVFERFYTVPGHCNTGNGLGLATVETVARQLGGEVSLHNRSDRSGLIARVLLPMTPRPQRDR